MGDGNGVAQVCGDGNVVVDYGGNDDGGWGGSGRDCPISQVSGVVEVGGRDAER